jgi:molybdate transport system substrate-binding protein
MTRRGRLLLAAALLLGFAAAPAAADEVRAAVAANFAGAVRRIAPAFERETGHRLIASFASTGTLYTQIRNGAPYDVFLAADERRPALLERDGDAVPGTRFTYALGRLALWSATPGLAGQGAALLERGDFRALAIANPVTAPYGAAAQQVLEHLGLWQRLQPRLVRGENIAQAYAFVASGNAPLGFVALAQVQDAAPAPADIWLPPPDWYQPIVQQAVLLRRGAANPAARDWLAYLRKPAARATLIALGYALDPATD